MWADRLGLQVAARPDASSASGAGGRRPRLAAIRGAVARTLTAVRRVAGMPDYAAHIEHLRRCHPDRPLPTRRQHFEDYLRTRYEGGPTRCC
jgi:uncharacterized short protein YbdD (DUF466 family)